MKIVSNGKTLEVPSCSSQGIYSTEERVVGRWIDGKPLYRIAATGGSVQFSGNWTKMHDFSSCNMDTVVDIVGTYVQTSDGAKKSLNCSSIDLRIYTDGWFYLFAPSDVAFDSWLITVLYTKTSDQSVIVDTIASYDIATTSHDIYDDYNEEVI